MTDIPEEQRQWSQKKGKYPNLKDDPPLVNLNLDSQGIYQEGSEGYPVYPHIEDLIKVLTEPLSAGIFTLNANSDYPYPKLNHLENLIPVLTEPLPAGIFRSTPSNNYPHFVHTEDLIPVLTKPYPEGIFISNKEEVYPFMTHIDNVIPILTKPYPEGIFIGDSERSYPYMTHLNLVPLGICYFTENLSEIDIPSTMETISNYSFFGTSITEIELPEGCTFYRHSFPENTNIKEVNENGQ